MSRTTKQRAVRDVENEEKSAENEVSAQMRTASDTYRSSAERVRSAAQTAADESGNLTEAIRRTRAKLRVLIGDPTPEGSG